MYIIYFKIANGIGEENKLCCKYARGLYFKTSFPKDIFLPNF